MREVTQDTQLSLGRTFNSFGESSNMHCGQVLNGPPGFLAGLGQDNHGLGYDQNFLGYCEIQNKNDMTPNQIKLTEYFEFVR